MSSDRRIGDAAASLLVALGVAGLTGCVAEDVPPDPDARRLLITSARVIAVHYHGH